MDDFSLGSLYPNGLGLAFDANLAIFGNLLIALLLGCLVGYERAYHGRAAGMRTFGLVCMASCALVSICGYGNDWFGGSGLFNGNGVEPTRVIQGIVTGIGFLGVGVIMREGLNISGLTTAASIWSSSAIGVLVGVEFYTAALLMALLATLSMLVLSRLEARLPQRPALSFHLFFQAGSLPEEAALRQFLQGHGLHLAKGSVSVNSSTERLEWRFVALARDRRSATPLIELSRALQHYPQLLGFELAHARN